MSVEPISDDELASLRKLSYLLPDLSPALVYRLVARLDAAEAEIRRHHADFEKWEAMADRGASRVFENRRLRTTLIDAREMVADWAAYADDYFKEKHGLADDLAHPPDEERESHSGECSHADVHVKQADGTTVTYSVVRATDATDQGAPRSMGTRRRWTLWGSTSKRTSND